MPKVFSRVQKKKIRDKLLSAGRASIRAMGREEKSVADMAREAGISTGAFYHFYSSKEELYFDVFLHEQDKITAAALVYARRKSAENVMPEQVLSEVLILMLEKIKGNPVCGVFLEVVTGMVWKYAEVYPEWPARLQELEREFARKLLAVFDNRGWNVNADSEWVIGTIRALYCLYYGRNIIGNLVYSRMEKHIAQSLAAALNPGA